MRAFPMIARLGALTGLVLLTGGCQIVDMTVANHAGPIAAKQWELYVIVGVVLVFVAGPVLILAPLFAWKYRLTNDKTVYRPDWNFNWPLEGLIWIPPTAIVIGLGFVLWNYTHTLDPYRPLASDQPPIEIEAVAFDWKWLFIYPEEGIASVDRLTVPTDRAVHIRMTSGTVMQSLLAPRLFGQIYAMAGMETQLNFSATETGRFRGLNTQYNGAGFARQKFEIVALPADRYTQWVGAMKTRAQPFEAGTLDAMFRPSVSERPLYFRGVPQNVFAAVLHRSTHGPALPAPAPKEPTPKEPTP